MNVISFFFVLFLSKMPRRLRRRKSSISIASSSDDNQQQSTFLLPLDERDESWTIGKQMWMFNSIGNRKQSESWRSIIIQMSLIMATIIFCFYTYFWFEHFHYYLTRFYAHHVDDHHAQHVLGHKLIRNRSHAEAFHWFRKSADHGHPHSAYNLAVGHLSGYRTDVKQGEVRQLLRFAAKNGVQEAHELLRGLCREKPKYCDL
ncbi:uncharacterized protein LOC124491086 [Dermatophagoides farinae]|uniref:uncharacterized protein LOC124491086 n=1 Tax=Dermatophagoides farinae TaxID=6954 RepID=UPI003F6166A8